MLKDIAAYVPNNKTFQAVDLVWKLGDFVIGAQIHTARHNDVTATFEEMCMKAGWAAQYNGNLYLLYLCMDSL
jgi:hypothetical protein